LNNRLQGNPGPEEYLVLANVLICRDPLTAEKILRDGLQKFPSAPGFHLLLGELHAARAEDAEAFYEFQWELLRTGGERPTGAEAAKRSAELLKGSKVTRELVDLTRAVAAMGKDPKAARQLLEKLIRKRGNRFVLRLYFCEAVQRAGDVQAATEIYRELLERDPYFVPGYVQLSELLDQTGNFEEAKALRAKAQSIDPDHWRLVS
jgi:tetratricopeptide (TPR) repeat protein